MTIPLVIDPKVQNLMRVSLGRREVFNQTNVDLTITEEDRVVLTVEEEDDVVLTITCEV